MPVTSSRRAATGTRTTTATGATADAASSSRRAATGSRTTTATGATADAASSNRRAVPVTSSRRAATGAAATSRGRPLSIKAQQNSEETQRMLNSFKVRRSVTRRSATATATATATAPRRTSQQRSSVSSSNE